MLGGLLGGGSSSSQQSESGPLPWLEDPYLKDMVEAVWNVDPKQYYPGDTYIGRNLLNYDALNGMLGYSMGQAPWLVDQAMGSWGNMMSSADVGQNPYVQNMLYQQGLHMGDTLANDLLPTIRDNAVMAGQSGSSRHGIAEGLAMQGAEKALADSAAKIQLGAYDSGLNTQLNALQQAGQLFNLGMAPWGVVDTVGNAYVEDLQMPLDEQIARWNFNQQEPYDRLGWQASIFNSVPTYSKSSSTSESSQGMGGLLGGIAQIAGLF